MPKKLYHIGFEKTKKLVIENKKLFRQNINDSSKLHFFAIFGKSYYELKILDFFKQHSIQKDTSYAMRLFEYFKSTDFIIQTLQYSGLDTLLENEEKKSSKDFLVEYFYNCCYLLSDKLENHQIEESLFYKNFLHHSSSLTTPSNIKIHHEAIVKNILKPNIPKESFGQLNDTEVFFKIIHNGKTIVSLTGTSIKTLRKKGYKQFLKILLETPAKK